MRASALKALIAGLDKLSVPQLDKLAKAVSAARSEKAGLEAIETANPVACRHATAATSFAMAIAAGCSAIAARIAGRRATQRLAHRCRGCGTESALRPMPDAWRRGCRCAGQRQP